MKLRKLRQLRQLHINMGRKQALEIYRKELKRLAKDQSAELKMLRDYQKKTSKELRKIYKEEALKLKSKIKYLTALIQENRELRLNLQEDVSKVKHMRNRQKMISDNILKEASILTKSDADLEVITDKHLEIASINLKNMT